MTTAHANSSRAGDGRYTRPPSQFRDWVSADGSTGYPAEPGRYHLYVSLACPWAQRTLILRQLKGLHEAIGLSIVDPIRDEQGWAFRDVPGATGDLLDHGWEYLSEAYMATDERYDGRISVPVLWDTDSGRIVNNESADVIVMLNSAFDEYAVHPERDYYPAELRADIDALNERIYEHVNDGVYRAGFARSQEAYEEAALNLFAMLDELDDRLASQRYLLGERQTLADWRLFTTLLRFDPVYHGHFKCNLRRIVDYPNLWPYLRDLYQTPGVPETVDMDHIKRHYYLSHKSINPNGLVPVGPDLDLWEDPGRG